MGRSGIILNPAKFQFCSKDVEFAGFCITNTRVAPLPKYLDAIRLFPVPKNITDIRSWFGLINQVAGYGQLLKTLDPFRPFLSPRTRFEWTTELQDAFETGKLEIVKAIKRGVEIFDQRFDLPLNGLVKSRHGLISLSKGLQVSLRRPGVL